MGGSFGFVLPNSRKAIKERPLQTGGLILQFIELFQTVYRLVYQSQCFVIGMFSNSSITAASSSRGLIYGAHFFEKLLVFLAAA